MNNYGYKKEEITPDQYIFGASSLPLFILQPDGQWDNFTPDDEEQMKNGLETVACTTFNTLNALEILFKRLFPDGQNVNFSDRYVAICSGNTPSGNSPQTVIEAIRKECGLIAEKYLPFSDSIMTWDEFYYPSPMSLDLLAKGRKFLDSYSVGHEWVFRDGDLAYKQHQMKLALQSSPLGVSVYAWYKNELGLYVKEGEDNHWTCCYGYEDGVYWKIFDSYDNTHKKLAWDFDFGCAKRYHLEMKTTPAVPTKNWLEAVCGIFSSRKPLAI